MGDEKMYPYISMAIKHEESLIKLREKQIAGYKLRIKLLKVGHSYGSVQRLVPGISANLKFDWSTYHNLKRQVAKHGK